MTTFKIGADDSGLRGVQEGNKTPVVKGPVQAVKASNPLQKSPENLPTRPGITEAKNLEVHHPHRRHADRRKSDTPVMLDTRSSHDRRTKTDKSEDAKHTLHGIDETV